MGGREGIDFGHFKADQHPSLDGYEEIHILIFTLNTTRGEHLLDPIPQTFNGHKLCFCENVAGPSQKIILTGGRCQNPPFFREGGRFRDKSRQNRNSGFGT